MSADLNLVFCQAQATNGTDTTINSTDWIDGKVIQDWAGGVAPVAEIIVTTAGAGGGTFVKFAVAAVDSSGNNPQIIATTDAYAATSLVPPTAAAPQGTIVHLKLSDLATFSFNLLSSGANRTHLRLLVQTIGAVTGLAITAHLIPEGATNRTGKSYAAGY